MENENKITNYWSKLLLFLIIVFLGYLTYYKFMVFDKKVPTDNKVKETEKNNENIVDPGIDDVHYADDEPEDIDINKQVKNNEEIKLCEESFDFDNGKYKYEMYRKGEDLIIQLLKNAKKIYENNRKQYFVVDSSSNKKYCVDNKIEMILLKSDANYKYYAIKWLVDDSIFSYIVYSVNEGNTYSKLADLSISPQTGYKDNKTGEELENYKVSDGSLYVIKNNCTDGSDIEKEKTFKFKVYEEKYSFKDGKYTKELIDSPDIEAVSGAIC